MKKFNLFWKPTIGICGIKEDSLEYFWLILHQMSQTIETLINQHQIQ